MCSPEPELIVYSTTVFNKGDTISQRESEVSSIRLSEWSVSNLEKNLLITILLYTSK